MATESVRAPSPRCRARRADVSAGSVPNTMPAELGDELDELACEILIRIDEDYEATTPFVRDDATLTFQRVRGSTR